MKDIVVIGAGTMGNGIAQSFAQYGFNVKLIDYSEDALKKALSTIKNNLDRMISKEKISLSDKTATLTNIQTYSTLAGNIDNIDLVIEAITENVDIKTSLFKQLDSICQSKTILATNTSSISIAQLAENTNRPDKVIGMHFMNPVPLMKLVEVIRGKDTSSYVTETIMKLSTKIDKVPVEVCDSPGFVSNRILMPMINEAIETLQNKVAGVYEIDTVMKLGMAHPMGPLQLADLIGLDVCLSILNVIHNGFKNPKYAPCSLLKDMVNQGKLGVKSGEGFYDYSENKKAVQIANQFLK